MILFLPLAVRYARFFPQPLWYDRESTCGERYMRGWQVNWRWVALIGFIALLASGPSLPWPMTVLVLVAGGSYLIGMAWRISGGVRHRRQTPRVTYWRGQRIDMPGPDRRPPSLSVGAMIPSIVYALIGLALLIGAILVVLNRSGI
ncbi:MAG: hypothetical protein HGA65_02710 [Oscillochloris sp.]|nr:hypothetical protein [Oscillochloris sp.]